jgi:hypothetical protein
MRLPRGFDAAPVAAHELLDITGSHSVILPPGSFRALPKSKGT